MNSTWLVEVSFDNGKTWLVVWVCSSLGEAYPHTFQPTMSRLRCSDSETPYDTYLARCDLKQTEPSSTEFSGRVKVVKELLEHHIEEEETEMFPQAKKLLGKAVLEELGAQMEDMKATYKKTMTAKAMAA